MTPTCAGCQREFAGPMPGLCSECKRRAIVCQNCGQPILKVQYHGEKVWTHPLREPANCAPRTLCRLDGSPQQAWPGPVCINCWQPIRREGEGWTHVEKAGAWPQDFCPLGQGYMQAQPATNLTFCNCGRPIKELPWQNGLLWVHRDFDDWPLVLCGDLQDVTKRAAPIGQEPDMRVRVCHRCGGPRQIGPSPSNGFMRYLCLRCDPPIQMMHKRGPSRLPVDLQPALTQAYDEVLPEPDYDVLRLTATDQEFLKKLRIRDR